MTNNTINKNLNILPGSIKEFTDQKDKVRHNFDKYVTYGFDDYFFKAIRDKYVDTSINELGSIFFSFEYVDVCKKNEHGYWATALAKFYSDFNNDSFVSLLSGYFEDFMREVGAESIKKNLTIRVHNLSVPKFKAGDDYEPVADADEFHWTYQKGFVKESEFLDFEFSEFAYFVFNFQKPKGDYWLGQDVEEAEQSINYRNLPKIKELFSLKGFLIVRNILGYNESEPLIREIESRRPFFHSAGERFRSPFGGNFCLKALRTPEEAKEYWDSLVEPASILNVRQEDGLDLIRHTHASLFFRPNIAEFDISRWDRECYKRDGYFLSAIDFYSNKYINMLHEHYFYRSGGSDYKHSAFANDAFGNQPINDPRILLRSSILGVPVKCSYTTPSVLYNLFNIFVKVNNIFFKEGIYYQTIDNSFIKPLGGEQWFREHYFEIVDNLFFHFDFFVRGVDYFKLFSLQIDNVLTIMKMIPLDGTERWRIKASGTSVFPTNFDFLKTTNKITYVSN